MEYYKKITHSEWNNFSICDYVTIDYYYKCDQLEGLIKYLESIHSELRPVESMILWG